MSHPYIVINQKNWNIFLSIFAQTIAAILLNDGVSEEATERLVGRYVAAIDQNKDNIFRATSKEVADYVSFYAVSPTEGVYDEFKGIYFLGLTISSHLRKLDQIDLNKLHLRAVLRLLDYRLLFPHKLNRDILTKRILLVIKNDAVLEHLGKYGWYLIYKCLFNSALDKNKQVKDKL